MGQQKPYVYASWFKGKNPSFSPNRRPFFSPVPFTNLWYRISKPITPFRPVIISWYWKINRRETSLAAARIRLVDFIFLTSELFYRARKFRFGNCLRRSEKETQPSRHYYAFIGRIRVAVSIVLRSYGRPLNYRGPSILNQSPRLRSTVVSPRNRIFWIFARRFVWDWNSTRHKSVSDWIWRVKMVIDFYPFLCEILYSSLYRK